MFQFRRFPSIRYVLAYGYHLCGGFPHSDISGSMDICSSPKLFAAYHVFHRLSVPRHPPCALLRLTFSYACVCVWVFKILAYLAVQCVYIRNLTIPHYFTVPSKCSFHSRLLLPCVKYIVFDSLPYKDNSSDVSFFPI